MAKVLYITANPKAEKESLSLTVGRTFLDTYRQKAPQDQIVEIDLYQTDLPMIDPDVFSAWGKLQKGEDFDRLSAEEKRKVSRMNELADQFIAADKCIFVTPLWNLSIPPRMKAYIDSICIAGKTFKYTEQGPVGLLQGKKAVHIQARGGVYSEGPAKDFEFGDRYLRAILTFLGVDVSNSVIIEGADYFVDQRQQILDKALEKAMVASGLFAQG
ncbi:FMN-dependent NADH-azoreductase [Heliobacterium chlorum]|uniref:FMN dependent NADH:quinone oxidoreductase n=1 Tax=Heliobacterium chlorum TaxID=2698 RepID=A0ABR7T0S9_HELCL|nr:FMN-dependent NADH-azoreductase [Heliobacterium chlorum]MBC9784399.1 FMN-dependent NADH-azoreductase [Heliobacterium chlorum]